MPPAIGIDLGTSFSCVACYRNGRAEIIADRQGKHLVPSLIYINSVDGRIHLGESAHKLSTICPENVLRDAKRLIGRKYDDEAVAKFLKQNETIFKLVKGADDMVAFEVEIQRRKLVKKPEEVSAEVLKYLKEDAERFLNTNVTEAVISVPAYFSNAQRKATKRAAEMAGLKVLKLITEPVAGAIHYMQNREVESKIMVFDWGGGTLDVSFINISKRSFEVKAVYGDTNLGGRDIDDAMFKRFYVPVTRRPREFIRRLANSCLIIKENLSFEVDFSQKIVYYDGENDMDLYLTREEFEKINAETFERVMDIVEFALSDVGWNKEDISEVILVGGSTRIPFVKTRLTGLFGQSKIKTDVNPDEAVALGACIQAAILQQQSVDLERYKITEVTPMSLGLDGYGDLMTVFITKNSKLPASASRNRVSVYNDQNDVTFDIFEGERKNNKHNNKLGTFKLSGLPKKRAGDVTFGVKMNLDEDGILTVTATEETTGKKNKLVVTMSEFRLSEHRIKVKLREAKKMKNEDDLFEEFITRRNALIKKCRQIQYDLNKISSTSDRQTVSDKCEAFITLAESLDFLEMDKLEGRFAVFNGSISHILENNGMLEIGG